MKLLDLFSGAGMHALGFRRAGLEIIGFCEIEPVCREYLKNNFPGVPIHDDVKSLTAEAVLAKFGRPDIIAGGFPCTDISVAGKGAGISKGTRSGLWRELFRLARGLRPAWLVVENVPALKTRGYDRVADALARIGYAVTPAVVGAWAVGAPHKRDRVWIAARLHDHRAPRHLAHAHGERIAIANELWRGGGAGWTGASDAGRSSADDVAHPERLRRERREGCAEGGERDGEDAGWIEGDDQPAGEGSDELADAECGSGPRQREPSGMGRREPGPGEHPHLAWPARPGEPQHTWEAPRLLELPLGGTVDGVPVRLVRAANRNALKALGNGNPPHVPELIGRWILAQEGGAA